MAYETGTTGNAAGVETRIGTAAKTGLLEAS